MDEIINFSGLLRENGIPASIRSTQSAVKVVKLINENGPLLKEGLASVYLKEQGQREKFDSLFDEFFTGLTAEADEDEEGDKSSKNSRNSLWSTKTKNNWTVAFQEDHQIDLKAREISVEEINYHPPLDGFGEDLDESELLHRDINTLDSFQPELFQLCQKMGRKIATMRSRRLRHSSVMRPDVRRTIRKNLQYGGTLIKLVRSRPKLKKNHHFFLNDVSGSCDWISNWFFCLVYAAQNSFRGVRVFDFDHKAVETTPALEENTLMDAFIKVRDIRQKNLMIHGTSNMHQAFQAFRDQVRLNRRSTLIILTDCRDWAGPKNDGKPLSAEMVGDMTRKSRKVMIFNPEDRMKWNVVDSCVSHYQDSGAEVYEVRNLQQLASLVTTI
jgi:uncharacterized protein with von Willebrand factor type A (vWA) domain